MDFDFDIKIISYKNKAVTLLIRLHTLEKIDKIGASLIREYKVFSVQDVSRDTHFTSHSFSFRLSIFFHVAFV